MADPVLIDCPADTWTKVVTNETSGMIHIKDSSPNVYLQTYRDTGGGVPTLADEGVIIEGNAIEVSSSGAIDVYIYPKGAAGRVRVDL